MNELVDAIKENRSVLFVGAGVSQNIGLPSWQDLMDHMAEKLGFDPGVFRTLGDYLTLAEYYKLEKGVLGPLRSWMDREWHKSSIDIGKSEIHCMIVRLRFPLIYTTNFDRWLERAHEHFDAPFVKIRNVADLIQVREGDTQIVKLHGDFDDDESLVLTDSSYLDRLNLERPLDIKLKHDLLGKSVLFIGYSLTDINIRYLLYQIHRTWSSSVFASMRPQSYVFLSRPNVVQEKVLEARGIKPLVGECDDPGEGLKSFLRELTEKVGCI